MIHLGFYQYINKSPGVLSVSEWDDDLFPDQKKNKKQQETIKGPCDILLTVFTLIATAGAAFLVAYLTKGIESRPFWLLALCFAAPVAALMFSAWLKEKIHPSMTPNTSRKAQLILVLCSVLAAAVVGCFSQITNTEAKEVQEVSKTGWSNVLIILDKSGSMDFNSRNENATTAVVNLISQMEPDTEVGLLIDADWNNNSIDHIIDITPLDVEHKRRLISAAHTVPYNTADFGFALDTAARMLASANDPASFTVLYISDGTDPLVAANYSEQFISLGVKVNYLYVDADHSNDLEKLASLTGGKSVFTARADELTDQMQQIATHTEITYITKDALRDINESATAKFVTAILLLLLGLLIGFSLTVMFSLQGQKRAQLIISPLMALCAFLVLAFGKDLIPVGWIREGVAFALLGIVIMRSNRLGSNQHQLAPTAAVSAFPATVSGDPAINKTASSRKSSKVSSSSENDDSIDDLW